MGLSKLQWLRGVVVSSIPVFIVLCLWLISDVGTSLQPLDPFQRIFSNAAHEMLPWWQILFRFSLLLTVLLLTFAVLWAGSGALVIGEAYLLSMVLNQGQMRQVFDGFLGPSLIRRVVSGPLLRLLGRANGCRGNVDT